MNNCPVCNKTLITWYALGGQQIIGCSDIKCNYKLGQTVKIEKPKENINSWI